MRLSSSFQDTDAIGDAFDAPPHTLIKAVSLLGVTTMALPVSFTERPMSEEDLITAWLQDWTMPREEVKG